MEKRISAAEFAAFLKERIGEGCVMGAAGQRAGELDDWYFYGQYAGEELAAVLELRRENGRLWGGMGLVEGFLRERTGAGFSMRAGHAFRCFCDPRGFGSIPPELRLPGAALFRGEHAAAFLLEPVDARLPGGDWYAVGANDAARGVERIRISEGGWDRWGLLSRFLSYGEFSMPMELPLGARLLKQGCLGRDVYQLQLLMGRLGWRTEAGAYMDASCCDLLRRMQAALDVRADGMYGEETHMALMARLDGQCCGAAPEKKTIGVLRETPVRRLPRGSARRIGMLFPGMDAEWIGENPDWVCVEFCGASGWIPRETCERKEN